MPSVPEVGAEATAHPLMKTDVVPAGATEPSKENGNIHHHAPVSAVSFCWTPATSGPSWINQVES